MHIYEQLKIYAELYRIMLKRFHIPDQPLETLMNLEYLMGKNSNPKVLECISAVMQEVYNEGLLGEDNFLSMWYKGQLQGLDNHFLFFTERDQAYKIHCKEFIDWMS